MSTNTSLAQVFICKIPNYNNTPLAEKHAVQTRWATALLHKVCVARYGKDANTLGLRKLQNGKWIADGAYFSVSHSGGYIAVATAHCPVGIDLQKCANADMHNIARRFFTQREQLLWDNSVDGFFFTWCKKEALWKSLDVQPQTTALVETSDTQFCLQKFVWDSETYYLAVTGNAHTTIWDDFTA